MNIQQNDNDTYTYPFPSIIQNTNTVTTQVSCTIPPKQYPFRIVTSNVQGINTDIKQRQLMNYIKINHISIMGLSETKLQIAASKQFLKDDNYVSYFGGLDTASQAGVGLI